MVIFQFFEKYFFTKYERLIFVGKVLNYERHLTYFQFSIFRKIIESSLEDLNYTHVTKLTQEQEKKLDG